jgi:predicted nucleotidyltransferase
MYGLEKNTIEGIRKIFQKFPEVDRALLYGSRAKGNFRRGSDIDLVIEGAHLDLSLLQKIEVELDDLMFPYKIDLSLLNQIQNDELLDHIKRVGTVFYERGKYSK